MFSKSVVALALVGSAIANPLLERGVCKDSCAAAVTGSAALGDHGIRESHCASFLATTVTPPAITTTVTITGTSTPSWDKRSEVTYCPNTVPVYATSACSGTAAYSSACSCFGYTADSTTTIAPTTTTKTVYVVPTYESTCSSATSTVTVTTTKVPVGATGSGYYLTATSTVTVTTTQVPVGATGSGYYLTSTVTTTAVGTCPTANATVPVNSTSTCLTGPSATFIVNSFINFLENTNYDDATNFDLSLAEEVISQTFIDQSDSINYLIGVLEPAYFPGLGNPTFDGFTSFVQGQGYGQPEIPLVTTLNLEYGCDFIVWRWVATFAAGSDPVQGINLMYIVDGQLQTDYSEFDNAAWLSNLNYKECYGSCAAATGTAAAPASTNPSDKRHIKAGHYHPLRSNVRRTPNNMLGHY